MWSGERKSFFSCIVSECETPVPKTKAEMLINGVEAETLPITWDRLIRLLDFRPERSLRGTVLQHAYTCVNDTSS